VPPSWIFEITKLPGPRAPTRITISNFVKIAQSVVEILQFFYFFNVVAVCHLGFVWGDGLCGLMVEHSLTIQKVACLNLGRLLVANGLGQPAHMHVPESPSSIIWYWPLTGK